MRILFASAEVAPFSKAGGLADVAGSLPQALTPYIESVDVITPLYGQIDRHRYDIRPTPMTGELTFHNKDIAYTIHSCFAGDGKTRVLFVDVPQFFERDGIYTESDGEGFADNNMRYFFFQLVILDLVQRKLVDVDLLHCNDHHTGLLPVMVKAVGIKVKTIFTIHNFLYHGHFSEEDLELLPPEVAPLLNKTQWDNYSALLEAIDHSHRINTVSPGYAQELLAGINVDPHSLKRIQAAEVKFSGIVNGIDTDYWSPELDDHIPFHFSANDLQGKRLNKGELLLKSGLPKDLDAPVFGSISRLVENKGFPLIVELLDEFVELGAKFIFLGSGSPEIAEQLRCAQAKHPGHIAFDEGFNEPLAHLIEAGSDLFLMPSRFEPCGLNQLYSLRYGTIPVVHRTGGLGDTVEPWTNTSGTGFLFEPYEVEKLRECMLQSIQVFNSPDAWKRLMKRAMQQDFSWDQSAKQYLSLYNS